MDAAKTWLNKEKAKANHLVSEGYTTYQNSRLNGESEEDAARAAGAVVAGGSTENAEGSCTVHLAADLGKLCLSEFQEAACKHFASTCEYPSYKSEFAKGAEETQMNENIQKCQESKVRDLFERERSCVFLRAFVRACVRACIVSGVRHAQRSHASCHTTRTLQEIAQAIAEVEAKYSSDSEPSWKAAAKATVAAGKGLGAEAPLMLGAAAPPSARRLRAGQEHKIMTAKLAGDNALPNTFIGTQMMPQTATTTTLSVDSPITATFVGGKRNYTFKAFANDCPVLATLSKPEMTETKLIPQTKTLSFDPTQAAASATHKAHQKSGMLGASAPIDTSHSL